MSFLNVNTQQVGSLQICTLQTAFLVFTLFLIPSFHTQSVPNHPVVKLLDNGFCHLPHFAVDRIG